MNWNTLGYIFKRALLGCAIAFIAVMGILGFFLRCGSDRRSDDCRAHRGEHRW
ncbi:MAG: hypothetical protein ABFD98_18765 [Syntrophobacteraceae bacterium]|nr:hypothetical protein [Desulfobacteraceae bacterium]